MDDKAKWDAFFRMMIIEEQGAEKKYDIARELATSEELKKVFAKLAGEEKFHQEMLESELFKLEKK
ncbi:MAG: hypothetical protein M1570_08355 [Chloroflexi bacterium]|nr:hypothetical protein [Chloroflexota bacterium]